mgnify:CR=1 FL=1
MEEKTTDDLLREMMESDIDSYLSKNESFFMDDSVMELLNKLYKKKKITKAALAKKSGMSGVYLHQVFSGRRRPSRDRLLCLCIGLEATLEETQRLLQQGVYAQLYVRQKKRFHHQSWNHSSPGTE